MTRNVWILALAAVPISWASALDPGDGSSDPIETMGPYLQAPDSRSALLVWWTSRPTVSVVELRGAGGLARAIHEVEPATDHRVTLDRLEPDTAYDYRILGLEGERTAHDQRGRFRTLPEDDAAEFRIVYLAGARADGFEEVVEAFEPHLLLVGSGEVGMSQGLADWRRLYSSPSPFQFAPALPAIGAGSYEGTGIGGTALAGQIHRFHRLHTLPGNEEWYRVRGPRTLVLVANSTWYADPARLLVDQTKWLDQTLREATDGADDPVFKIVLAQAPPPGSSRTARDLAEECWTRAMGRFLFARRGVDLVLAGCGAETRCLETSGVRYVAVASDSPSDREARFLPRGRSLFEDRSTRTIALVKIAGRKMDVAIRDVAGRALHEFTIEGR